ncbi:aga operon transcriptional regulator AgaR [Tessaracoccus lubricantis]|uniref:Aga operon transcriptional regulator AgaR n=1 Tax=Tessaracoccus lubricantis TaxID=545543 RepID=A0ABP9FEM4_9ACTN
MVRPDEAERRESIHRALERLGRATVADLAREFGVSTVTIRKDLDALERRGLLTRIHGGATRTTLKDEGSFPFRLMDAAEHKRDIARRAARLVHSGDTIALDSSSTCHYLARELLELRDLTVITYSLATASLLLDGSSATVFLLGGQLRRSSRATTLIHVDGVNDRIDMGFFGAHGASYEEGLAEISMEEADSKRALTPRCNRLYALVDSSKFGATSYHVWLPAQRVTGLITDGEAPAAQVERWRDLGVYVDTGSWPSSPRSND